MGLYADNNPKLDFNRILFENSIIPTFIIDIDNYQVVDNNLAVARLFMLEEYDEYVGKTLEEIGQLIVAGKRLTNSFLKHIEQGIRIGSHVFEWKLIYFDGQPWDGEIYLLKFTHNNRQFLQISIKDISEYKRSENACLNANSELRDSYEQLAAHEKELRASYEQLSAIEEELRLKYEELEYMQQELKIKEEKYRNMVESVDCVIFECNFKRVITYISPVAKAVAGYEEQELMGFDCFNFTHPDDKPYLYNLFSRINKNIEVRTKDFRIRTKTGDYKWMRSNTRIFMEEGRFITARGVIFDIHEQKMNEEKIHYLSIHDLLTGAYNRSYYETELKKYDKSEKFLPVSIIIADINGLKEVNDLYGQEEGDKLLKQAANILAEIVGSKGLVARIGGDEFAVLLEKCGDAEVKSVFKKVTDCCKSLEKENINLSISLGAATKYSLKDSIYKKAALAEERLYNKKLLESKSTRSHLITSLNNMMHEKTFETQEHCERLGELSRKVAQKMRLKEYQVEKLRLLSLMHDIGKIAIPENILGKPAQLEDYEWREMKKHAEIGYRIANKTPELATIAFEILSHHERWDGQGYPHGLKEKEIPLESRIIAVVDAYDAMTSDRVYRKAMPIEDAIQELLDNAGSQFDPEVVEIFVEDMIKH